MKKILSLTGIVAIAAVISASAYAANSEPGNPTNPVDQQSFFDNNAALRASLAADHAELQALMMSNDPDPKRVRALSETISKSQDELRRQSGGYPVMMGPGGSYMAMNYGRNHMNGYVGGCMW